MEKLISQLAACRILNLTKNGFLNAVRRNDISPKKLGKANYYKAKDIEYLKSHTKGRRGSISKWKGPGSYKDANGYVRVYCPEHPRAMSGGVVYEHVLKVEEQLGRFLTKGEEVHHKDKNRANNELSNLEFFTNSSEHMTRGHVREQLFKKYALRITVAMDESQLYEVFKAFAEELKCLNANGSLPNA